MFFSEETNSSYVTWLALSLKIMILLVTTVSGALKRRWELDKLNPGEVPMPTNKILFLDEKLELLRLPLVQELTQSVEIQSRKNCYSL